MGATAGRWCEGPVKARGKLAPALGPRDTNRHSEGVGDS